MACDRFCRPEYDEHSEECIKGYDPVNILWEAHAKCVKASITYGDQNDWASMFLIGSIQYLKRNHVQSR